MNDDTDEAEMVFPLKTTHFMVITITKKSSWKWEWPWELAIHALSFGLPTLPPKIIRDCIKDVLPT